MQICALTLEECMCADGEKNIQVAGWSTAHARLTFAGKPDTGAVLDPCGNIDRKRPLARHSPRAGTGGTWVVDHLTATLAGRTGPLQGKKSLGMTDASLTAASRTRFGSRAGLGTRPRARLASHRGRDAHLGILAGIGFLERDLHVVAQIGTALAPAAAPTSAAAHAEQVVEDIREGGRDIAKAASGTGTGMFKRGMTKAVISSALVRILEDFVGFVDLFEANFRTLIARIAVGMPLHRELAKGGFQFSFVRRALDPQNVVIAALRHACVHPRHFCRGIIAESYPVSHGASKNMHPEGFGPRGPNCNRNGMAGASPTSSRLFVLLVVVDLGELRIDDILSLAGAIPAGSGAAGLARPPITLADLGAVFGERPLRRMDESLGVVFGLDLGFALLVFLRVRFGVLDHALDVGL